MIVQCLFEELGTLSQVEAIALGGSRATGRNDDTSDYDVYVYTTSAIDEQYRKQILGAGRRCYFEQRNRYGYHLQKYGRF